MDMSTLGLMGNSGGGTATFFAGAVLERVRCAMPSCAFSSFQASIQSMFHCVCNYVPGLLQFAESADVAGLFAPRPLVIVSGQEDGIFPIGQARQQFERVQDIYRAAGAEERCHHVVGSEGHRFYAADAWPVMLAEMRRTGG